MTIQGHPISNLPLEYHAPQLALIPDMELEQNQIIPIVSRVPFFVHESTMVDRSLGASVGGEKKPHVVTGPFIYYNANHNSHPPIQFDGGASILLNFHNLFNEQSLMVLSIDRRCSSGQSMEVPEPPDVVPPGMKCRERGIGWLANVKFFFKDLMGVLDPRKLTLLPNEKVCQSCATPENFYIHSACRSQLMPVLTAERSKCKPATEASEVVTLDDRPGTCPQGSQPFAAGFMCCFAKPSSIDFPDYMSQIRTQSCEHVVPCPDPKGCKAV